jgi:hypothetical protein
MAQQDLADFAQSRLEAISPVQTTTTSSGAIVEWINPEQRLRPGATLATPPPALSEPSPVNADESFVAFELDQENAQLGPVGTVPMAGKNLEALQNVSLQAHVSKPGQYALPAGPGVTSEGFFRATVDAENQTCHGISAVTSVWQPTLEDDDLDHSLAEMWLVNDHVTPAQSVEAGWTVSRRQYGDVLTHLFSWFTTTGWTKQDDWVGGYDTDYAGWVQFDRSIYPGAVILGHSQVDGSQAVLSMQFELWNGDWWLAVNGRWIGYYAGALFGSAGDDTLASSANRALAGGEVYTSRNPPSSTTTQMGSGHYPGSDSDPRGVASWRSVLVTTELTPSPAPIDVQLYSDLPALFELTSYPANAPSAAPTYLFGGPNQPLAN